MRREYESVETYKSLTETRNRLADAQDKRIQEQINARKAFSNKVMALKEMRERKAREHSVLMEAARNDALATVVKAIYITALEAEALTDNGLLLAESMVDNWIEETGGATKILTPRANDSYLLSRITQIVEDAAEAAVKDIEKDVDTEPTEEKKEPSQKEKKDEALAAAKEFIKDAGPKSVADFMGKLINNAQTSAVTKAKDKEEEAAEEDEAEVDETEAEVKDDAAVEDKAEEAEATDDVETAEKDEVEAEEDEEKAEAEEDKEEAEKDAAEEEEIEADDAEAEAEVKEDEADNPESTEDANDDEDDIDLDSIPSDDEEVEATDSENGTPDTDPETDDETGEADSNEEDQSTEAPEEDEEENTLKDEEEVTDDDVNDDLDSKPLDSDGVDSDTTIDGDTENKGAIFDELEKEDDVQQAIDTIKQRVADAEETFIRNNAEDKKKMDEVLKKISANVKTVEDLAKKDQKKADIAQEAARMNKRKYDEITNNRPLTIFERMTRNLGADIIKNEAVKDQYMTEAGNLDVDLVVESAKVMYGFLETLNTLRLDNVNEAYIINVLKSMNK